jgi:hypothetical protein
MLALYELQYEMTKGGCVQVLEVAPLSDYQTTSPAVVAVVSGNRVIYSPKAF